MKLFGGLLALTVLSVSLTAGETARADLLKRVTIQDHYGTTNGGEFLAAPADFDFAPVRLNSITGEAFETFCLEVSENIAFGGTYWVDLNTAAVHGGAGGGDPDPLDPLTAYLYQQFISGTLAGYAYALDDGGTERAASADALQRVIWYIEQEAGMTWTTGDGSRSDLFYQDALANAGSDIGDVRVLNLYNDAQGTSPAQDQLVLIPEPASLVLLALGVAVALRRIRG